MRGLEEQGWFHGNYIIYQSPFYICKISLIDPIISVYLIDATGRPVLGKMYMVKIYDETEASDLREYLRSHMDQNASWRLDGVKGWLQRGTRQVSGVQLMRLAFSEPLKSEIISKVQDFYAE